MSFSSNVLKASDPQITSSTATNNSTYRDLLVMTTSKISLLGVAFVYLIFHLDGEYLLDIWLDKVPLYAFEFCEMAILATVFTSISLPFRTLIMATGRVKGYFLTYGVVSLTSMVIMFALLKWGYPMITVMFIILISNVIMFIAAVMYSFYYTKLSLIFVFKNIVLTILALLISGLVYYYLRVLFNDSIGGILLSSSLSLLMLLITSYLIALSPIERTKFNQLISRIPTFLHK